MHEKRHFWENVNTWVNSDLPAVDILNLIHRAAAAMWPPDMTATCLFCTFLYRPTEYALLFTQPRWQPITYFLITIMFCF